MVHPHLEARTPLPVRLVPLLSWQALYPRKADTLYLAEGFSSGFCFPCEGECKHTSSVNLKSVCGLEEVVSGKLSKEIKLRMHLWPTCAIAPAKFKNLPFLDRAYESAW